MDYTCKAQACQVQNWRFKTGGGVGGFGIGAKPQRSTWALALMVRLFLRMVSGLESLRALQKLETH